jgi:sphingomyelin phosphodiesterase
MPIVRLLGLLLMAAASSSALGVTHVIVQNNTPFAFTTTVSAPRDIKSSAWTIGANVVEPGRRQTVLTFNRDDGVTSGKRFRFSTVLRKDGSNLTLLQELLGQTINSHLWQSLAGPGFEDPWFDDRNTHHATWNLNGTPIRVQYRAFFTGTDDNVEYILQYAYPPAATADWQFSVLAYNIYMRPSGTFKNGQAIRARLLPEVLDGYDAIVFSEAFDDDVRADLLARLKSRYPYATKIVGQDGIDKVAVDLASAPTDVGGLVGGADRVVRQDGGVVIVSRWPIQEQDQETFGSRCSGTDCLSDKGVAYAKIVKGSRTYHLFGTHTQAWPTAQGRARRAEQFQQIKAFIDRKRISPKEPVLIAGDLNVDQRVSDPRSPVAGEFADMLRILEAQAPEQIGPVPSWDPHTNKLAEQGKPGEHLDYVLWSTRHRAPTASSNEVRLLRARNEWKEFGFETAYWDLSDHYPVHGLFAFEETPRFDMRMYSGNTLYVIRPSGELFEYTDEIVVDHRTKEERERMAQPVDKRAVALKEVNVRPIAEPVSEREKRQAGNAPRITPSPDRAKIPKEVSLTGQESVLTAGPKVKPQVEPGPPTTHRLSPGVQVGTGWQQFRVVTPAGGEALYALTPDGRLLWYRHDGYQDGSMRWTGPVEVARGWQGYTHVFGMGEGVVYGVRADGTLHWHRHNESRNARSPASWAPSRVVGSGWNQFTHIFGGGDGVIYAIRLDGTLLWYRHDGYQDGSTRWQQGKPVGTGWNGVKQVLGAGRGMIYVLTNENRLRYYVHTGWADGAPTWYAPAEVGRLENAQSMLVSLPHPVVVK